MGTLKKSRTRNWHCSWPKPRRITAKHQSAIAKWAAMHEMSRYFDLTPRPVQNQSKDWTTLLTQGLEYKYKGRGTVYLAIIAGEFASIPIKPEPDQKKIGEPMLPPASAMNAQRSSAGL